MLVALARLIASSSVDEALRTVVEVAYDLTDADIVYLTVADPEESWFVVRFAVGAGSESFDGFTNNAEVGLAGHVRRTGRPHWVPDYLNAPELIHAKGVDNPIRAEGIVSMLGVPLIANGQFLGTLNVAHRFCRAFTEDEMSVLEAFGHHASVALENAHLREQNAATIASLQEAYRTIEAATVRHDALSRLVLAEGELSQVADWLARELSGEVTVTDRDGLPQSLHGSAPFARPGVLRRRLSADVSRLIDESAASGRCATSEERSGAAVHAVALVAENEIRGALVLRSPNTLSPNEIQTLEHAGHVATLVSLAHEAVADAEARARGDLLSHILDGRFPYPRTTVLRARAQGVELARNNVLAVLDVAPSALPQVSRLLDGYARQVNGLSGVDRGHPVILLPGESGEDAAAAVHTHLRRP